MSTLATREEINHCQFHEWYDKFEKNTIKSRIVPLPKEFIDYLKEDNIMIPDTLATDPNSTEDEEEIDDVCQRFSELNNKIKSSMDELKNEVFIKTNWSCPKDVSWMIGGSLKCFNLRDIYLLLKSSDRVMYDFESIYEHCEDKTVVTEHYLILRRWCNLNPSMEFRLFVYDEELVGKCIIYHCSTLQLICF